MSSQTINHYSNIKEKNGNMVPTTVAHPSENSPIHIIYKQGLGLYITDWFSRENHIQNKDKDKDNMKVCINDNAISTNIHANIKIQDIQRAPKSNTK